MTHCPTQVNQGFPVSACEPLHHSSVSRGRGRALKWAGEQKQQQADLIPILSHVPFFIIFTAISSACRHMVYKMEKLIRPQICFNLSKEGEKFASLSGFQCPSSGPLGCFGAAQSCTQGRGRRASATHTFSPATASVPLWCWWLILRMNMFRQGNLRLCKGNPAIWAPEVIEFSGGVWALAPLPTPGDVEYMDWTTLQDPAGAAIFPQPSKMLPSGPLIKILVEEARGISNQS